AEDIAPFLSNSAGTPGWKVLEDYLVKKYPVIGKEAVARAKVRYYYFEKDYKAYADCFNDYLKNYREMISYNELNARAFDMFKKSSDKYVLEAALKWSKMSVDAEHFATDRDTYANLCYKLGKTDEAIEWEEKAMNMTEDKQEKKEFEETL